MSVLLERERYGVVCNAYMRTSVHGAHMSSAHGDLLWLGGLADTRDAAHPNEDSMMCAQKRPPAVRIGLLAVLAMWGWIGAK